MSHAPGQDSAVPRGRSRFREPARGASSRALALLAALVAAAVPSAARAQETRQTFRVDRFAPAFSPDDGIAVPHPRTLGDLRPSVGLILDYAYAPLNAQRGERRVSIVEHRLIGHVLGALGLGDRVELHVRVPVAFGAGATLADLPAVETFSMGDGALGGSVRILGEGDRQGLWLGAHAEVLLPLGASHGYASDLEVGARGLATVAYGTPVMTTLIALGAAYRPERVLENARAGTEIEFAVASWFAMAPWLDLFGELLGAMLAREPASSMDAGLFTARGTPLELLVGGRGRTDVGVAVEASVGLGLTSAAGVPTARAMVGLRWVMPPPAPGDADGDGRIDAADACRDEPEDVDGWQDGDGCPEPDNDRDGVMDPDDACAGAPEDADGIRDGDGCPDDDDDEDGVRDGRDNCPRAPGPDWTRGCPQLIRLLDDRIDLLRPIEFDADGVTLVPDAEAVLEEIRATLAVDPRMRVRIEARGALEQGGRRRGRSRLDVGPQRAEAIAAWLVAHGIDAARIERGALPSGEDGPTVEVRVLDRTPSAEPRR